MARKTQSVARDAPIDLNLLPLFVAVAQAEGFSEAGKRLGLRRSSVSRAVAALERSLSVQLFNRTTRKVALTSAGSALLAKLAPQLSTLAGSLRGLPEQEAQPSGLLRVSAPTDIGAHVLPAVVTAFCQRFPGVQLEVLLSNRVVDLVAEQFDLAVRVAPQSRLQDSSLVARRVGGLQLELFASPTYLARAGTPRTARDLADHAWVVFRGMRFRAPLLPPRRAPQVSCDDVMFVHQAVKAGAGVGALPRHLVGDDVARGGLVQVAPKLSLPAGSVFLVHPPAQRVPRKVSAFTEVLLAHLSRNPRVLP